MKILRHILCTLFHWPEWSYIGGTTRRKVYHCWSCRTFRSWPRP